MKLQLKASPVASDLETLAIALDLWFYSYSESARQASEAAMQKVVPIENFRRNFPAPLQRAIIVDESRYLEFCKEGGLTPRVFESWQRDSDPSGYLGFVRLPATWVALLFSDTFSTSEVLVDLAQAGSNKQFQNAVDRLQQTNKIRDNINTVWSGGDGSPIDEVIVFGSAPHYHRSKLQGVKSYKTHRSPVSGGWLDPKELEKK